MPTDALSSNVLVLNKLWQAVDVCSVKRAICLLYLEHAQVVVKEGGSFYTFGFEEWRDFSSTSTAGISFISTISYRIQVPRVIMLMLYDRLPPRRIKFTRRNIYLRDNNTCQYCGKKLSTDKLNLDHVVPLSRGGRNTWTNVVCSCIPCNMRKGNKTLRQSKMRLIRKPTRPTWKMLVRQTLPATDRWSSWQEFLDVAYWNVELEHD